MARLVLVTGGSRSGKSRYGLQRAEQLPAPRTYVATCPRAVDDEMDARIDGHRRERDGRGWHTVEAPVALAAAVEACSGPTVLVDCLTLWIGNLLHERDDLDEAGIEARSRELAAVAGARPGTVIFVTNEVGSGIVPDNRLARRFRDLAGRANQTVADAAEEVVLLVSGVPLQVR